MNWSDFDCDSRGLDQRPTAAAHSTADGPYADVAVQQPDVTSPASVHAAADALTRAYARIDLLISGGKLSAGRLLPHAEYIVMASAAAGSTIRSLLVQQSRSASAPIR